MYCLWGMKTSKYLLQNIVLDHIGCRLKIEEMMWGKKCKKNMDAYHKRSRSCWAFRLRINNVATHELKSRHSAAVVQFTRESLHETSPLLYMEAKAAIHPRFRVRSNYEIRHALQRISNLTLLTISIPQNLSSNASKRYKAKEVWTTNYSPVAAACELYDPASQFKQRSTPCG